MKKSILTLFFGVLLGLIIFGYLSYSIDQADLRNIRVEQWYALAATFFLYVALLGNSLTALKSYQNNAIILGALFGLMHGSVAFFYLLGGFEGLGFLGGKYLIGISLSATALSIFLFIAFTQFLLAAWYKAHPSAKHGLYVILVFIVIHALMLGSHFHDLSSAVPTIFLAALIILVLLEARRLDIYFGYARGFGYAFALVLIASSLLVGYRMNSQGSISSLGVHSQHIAINNPDDSSSEVNVSMVSNRENIVPGQEVTFRFRVYDGGSGKLLTEFLTPYEKLMHLIIVDQDLKYFDHIHPEFDGEEFIVTTKFPQNSLYRLYLDFEPSGYLEKQTVFTVPVGNFGITNKLSADADLTKTFGDYRVELKLERGTIIFRIMDKDGKEITNLEQYLGAMGHLVLIHQDTYQYIHVHPIYTGRGPEVEFIPVGSLRPGNYRLFGQFQHDGKLFVADFTTSLSFR